VSILQEKVEVFCHFFTTDVGRQNWKKSW